MFFSFLLKILGADKEEEKTQRIISVLRYAVAVAEAMRCGELPQSRSVYYMLELPRARRGYIQSLCDCCSK